MLTWIIKIIIISVCFIFLVHYLLIFLKNTLTIPKTRDLVKCSKEKYDKMCSVLENINPNTNKNKKYSNTNNSETIDLNDYSTNIDALPVEETNSMKNELKMFLKSQMSTETDFLPMNNSIQYTEL